MTRVKICGCRSVEQALWAAEAGADFIGMVFAESRRRIELDQASEIVRALGTPLAELEMQMPPSTFGRAGEGATSWFWQGMWGLEHLLHRKRPLTVGVFANMDTDLINEIVNECGIDLIQLSGGEPWGHCLLANRQVIKAVHVSGTDSSQDVAVRIEPGSAMAVLLDRADAGAMGGTGSKFDWDVAAEVSRTMPVWLAGGLHADNVVEAIKTVQPWCVDVSSGVETDGIKDRAKIESFVRNAKNAS